MKNSLFRYVCLVVALLICSFADAQQKANYKLAEKFRLLEQNPIIKYSTEGLCYIRGSAAVIVMIVNQLDMLCKKAHKYFLL